jgi:hypothetical protein
MDNKITLGHYHLGHIPKFLALVWQEHQAKNRELITRKNYNPITDYELEFRDRFCVGVIKGILYLVMLMCFLKAVALPMALSSDESWQLTRQDYVTFFKFAFFLIVLSVISHWAVIYPRKHLHNGRLFFIWVTQLFNELMLRPDASLGNMSQEQFRGHLEKMMHSLANGFAVDRQRFYTIHKLASRYGLCHESVERYFKKATA